MRNTNFILIGEESNNIQHVYGKDKKYIKIKLSKKYKHNSFKFFKIKANQKYMRRTISVDDEREIIKILGIDTKNLVVYYEKEDGKNISFHSVGLHYFRDQFELIN